MNLQLIDTDLSHALGEAVRGIGSVLARESERDSELRWVAGLASPSTASHGGEPRRSTCPPGKRAAPKLGSHLSFGANGCGPAGLQVREDFGLHRCCNAHDVCFSVCGTSFDWCEQRFKSCMQQVCTDQVDGDEDRSRCTEL